ncbi:MAG: hypothetical protein GEV06_03525 [Luteitalea sp.]|nr:hypothetical protein [Luteitalea sp.]
MISYVAMERIAEREVASKAKSRKGRESRPFRAYARRWTDKDLLARLHAVGIDLDRPTLRGLCERTLSAEEITTSLLHERTFTGTRQGWDRDWVWICVATLWQRWFPEIPSFERLDDRMQDGYALVASGKTAAACRTWLEASDDVLHILDKAHITSIGEFDDRFRGTQSLFNWHQDLESELWNAGLQDRYFHRARIAVGEEFLNRFGSDDDLVTENWRRAVAESYYELGETSQADALYREWLTADPQWGWGWIG